MTTKRNNLSILIGGDVCPILRNESLFKSADVKRLFGKLYCQLSASDLNVINLECPLTEKGVPQTKIGPAIKGHPDCIKGLKAANISAVNLANNHIMDYGAEGFFSTIKICRDAGIETFGGGENHLQAQKMLIVSKNGIRVGFIGMAESEFSIASSITPGANPINPRNFLQTLKSEKKNFDILIVLLHAGAQDCPIPSPWMQDSCRFLIDLGADAVICQHSHCPGCYEQYEDGVIVYGQGNFIYDTKAKMNGNWNNGYLVRIDISAQLSKKVTFIPYVQSLYKAGAEAMNKDEKRLFLENIDACSNKILDPIQLYDMWREFCHKNRKSYYFEMVCGGLDNRIMRAINRRSNIAEKMLSIRHRLLLQNIIRCESHRETLLTLLRDL